MGLIVNVLRSNIGDRTLGGVSSEADFLCVVNIDGPFDPDSRFPAVLLVPGALGSLNIRPAKKDSSGRWIVDPTRGYSAGGNFAYSSDSRFGRAVGFYGAVAIHDREEAY